jgi:hypothetical protein
MWPSVCHMPDGDVNSSLLWRLGKGEEGRAGGDLYLQDKRSGASILLRPTSDGTERHRDAALVGGPEGY